MTPLVGLYGGFMTYLMRLGWCSTVLRTMASSLFAAMTLRMLTSNCSRAFRYSPYLAVSVFSTGFVHCLALLAGILLARSVDLPISSCDLNGELGFRAK